MKQKIVSAAIVLAMGINLFECGSSGSDSSSESVVQENISRPEVAEVAEEPSEQNIDDGLVSIPKERADLLEKYSDLIDNLENEEYGLAEAYVHNLFLEHKKE